MKEWISTGFLSFQKSSLDNLLENDQFELERHSRSNDSEETKHRLRITWLLENDSVLKDLSMDAKRKWMEANQDHKTKGHEVKELYEATLKANAIAAHRAELESHYALTNIFFWPGVPTSSGMQLHIAGQTWPLSQNTAYGMIWSENYSNASTQQMQAVAEQIDFLTLHFENARFRDDSPRRTNAQLSDGALAAGRGIQVELDASDRRLVLRALARVQSALNNRSTNIETEARILEEAKPKWKRRLIIGSILVVSALVILAAVFATPAWLGLLGVGGAGGILAAFGIAVSHIIPPAVITGIAIAADAIIGISLISLAVYAISKCIGFCRSRFSRKEPGYRAVDEFDDKSKDHDLDIQLSVLSDPYDRANVFSDDYEAPTKRVALQSVDLERGEAQQVPAKPKPTYIPSLAPRPAQPKQLANGSSAPRLAASANASNGASAIDRKEKKRLQKPEGSGRQLSSAMGAATVSGTASFSAAPAPHPQTFVPPAALVPAPAAIPSSPARTSGNSTAVSALQPAPSSSVRAVNSPAPVPAPQLTASSSARTVNSPDVATSLPTASSPARVVSSSAPVAATAGSGQGSVKKDSAATASQTSAAPKVPTPPPAPPAQNRTAPPAPKLPGSPAKSTATSTPLVSAPAAANSPQSSGAPSDLLASLQNDDPIAAMRARTAAKKAAAQKKAAAESTASAEAAASPAKPTAPVGNGTLFPAPGGNKKGAGKAAASPGSVAEQAAAALRAKQAKKAAEAAAGTPKM